MERFVDIKGYEGKYQVSNTGKVLSLLGPDGPRELTPRVDSHGVLRVYLQTQGFSCNRRCVKVACLVAGAFIAHPEGLDEILHKDGNKMNCQESNLEWASMTDLRRSEIATGSRAVATGERSGTAKLTAEKVSWAKEMREKGMSTVAIAKELGVSQPTISRLLTGKNWKGA